MSRLWRLQARASSWLMRRPARAWWSTLAGLFVITAAVPTVRIEVAADRGDWAPMVALTWMLILAALPLILPYVAHTRFDQVVALLCALCLAPTMLAVWAAARGGGRWLPVTGWVLSTLGVELVVRRAVRDGRAAAPDTPAEE